MKKIKRKYVKNKTANKEKEIKSKSYLRLFFYI